MWTYSIVEPGLVFETINRETTGAAFVATLIRLRYDRGGLLCHGASESVEIRYRRVSNVHVICCVLPDVFMIEWLNKHEQAGTTRVTKHSQPIAQIAILVPLLVHQCSVSNMRG